MVVQWTVAISNAHYAADYYGNRLQLRVGIHSAAHALTVVWITTLPALFVKHPWKK